MRLIFILVLLSLVNLAVCDTVFTTRGVSFNGEFVRKTNDLYFFKAADTIAFFEKDEIKVIRDNANLDVTQKYLDMANMPSEQGTYIKSYVPILPGSVSYMSERQFQNMIVQEQTKEIRRVSNTMWYIWGGTMAVNIIAASIIANR